jgi:hypothetical protein
MCCCPEGSKPILEGYLADEKLHSLTHGVRTPELGALVEGSESALRPVSVTVLGEIGLANARAWNLGWMASLLSPSGLSKSVHTRLVHSGGSFRSFLCSDFFNSGGDRWGIIEV